MTGNLPEKSEQLSVEDVTSLILSYNDPNLITQILEHYGWSCSQEILETLKVARQDVNLGAKMTAIKHIRTLLREAAEASGMVGKISRIVPGEDGTTTVFSAKRIATAFNPRKQIKVEEIKNDSREQEETDIGGSPVVPGGNTETDPGQDASTGETDFGRGEDEDRSGDNQRQMPERADSERNSGEGEDDIDGRDNDNERIGGEQQPGDGDNPCIQHQPPTCDQRLYPGVSGTTSAGERTQ